jgi:hypothetical protein
LLLLFVSDAGGADLEEPATVEGVALALAERSISWILTRVARRCSASAVIQEERLDIPSKAWLTAD